MRVSATSYNFRLIRGPSGPPRPRQMGGLHPISVFADGREDRQQVGHDQKLADFLAEVAEFQGAALALGADRCKLQKLYLRLATLWANRLANTAYSSPLLPEWVKLPCRQDLARIPL